MSGRPLRGEYGEHAERDIARVEGDDACEALVRQQGEFESLLASLDEPRIRGLRYAPGKWTVKEVIGHSSRPRHGVALATLFVSRLDFRHAGT